MLCTSTTLSKRQNCTLRASVIVICVSVCVYISKCESAMSRHSYVVPSRPKSNLQYCKWEKNEAEKESERKKKKLYKHPASIYVWDLKTKTPRSPEQTNDSPNCNGKRETGKQRWTHVHSMSNRINASFDTPLYKLTDFEQNKQRRKERERERNIKYI